MYLSWSKPPKTVEIRRGEVATTLGESPTHLDVLVKNEEIPLTVWMAERLKDTPTTKWADRQETIILNTEEKEIRQPLKAVKESHINIDLYLIGENYTDKKPHKYRLNTNSWDEVSLTTLD
jgi:hypothetical protein